MNETCAVPPETTFEKELQSLINKFSMENESNTPDFILAGYIRWCLVAFNTAVQQRENWYGRDPRPSIGDIINLHTNKKDLTNSK